MKSLASWTRPWRRGTYEVAFDGSSLASGTYVFRLVSGTTNAHRTMALLE
ncbi:MAG: hypothetical protein AAF089_16575 [Bacteroidota bacterium]